jgi:hypothetical protein
MVDRENFDIEVEKKVNDVKEKHSNWYYPKFTITLTTGVVVTAALSCLLKLISG